MDHVLALIQRCHKAAGFIEPDPLQTNVRLAHLQLDFQGCKFDDSKSVSLAENGDHVLRSVIDCEIGALTELGAAIGQSLYFKVVNYRQLLDQGINFASLADDDKFLLKSVVSDYNLILLDCPHFGQWKV